MRVFLLLLLLLIAAALAVTYALPWMLQKQGIDFHWQDPQWQLNGFTATQLQLTLPSDNAEPQHLQLDNLQIKWAWHSFPIQHLEASRLQVHWPINSNETTDDQSSLVLADNLLKWLPQQIELQEIDANLPGLGHLQGSLSLKASAQGLLWQPAFIHSQLTLQDLQGAWLESIPEEFRPTQLNGQITTHPDYQDNSSGQQLLTVDLYSTGPMRIQLNGLLDLQQTPSWQGSLKNAQLFVQLEALDHPELHAEQLQVQAYFEGHADTKRFAFSLNPHSHLEAHNLQLPGIVKAKKATVHLSGLNIQGLSSAPYAIELNSPLNVDIEKLSAEQLHEQDWNLTGTLSGHLPQLKGSGQLVGTHGLKLSTQIHLLEDTVQGDVTLEDVLFAKGNNPLQKTFTDWPEVLKINHGQLRTKIDFTLSNAQPVQLALKAHASELSGSLDNSIFKNLGLELSGDIDLQRIPDWQGTLGNGQFVVHMDNLAVPTLHAEHLRAQAYFTAQADPERFTVNFDQRTSLETHKLSLPEIGRAQKASVQLANLSLHGYSNAPHQIEVLSPIKAQIEQLSAEQLHSQNWDFNGTLSGSLPKPALTGDLNGQYGLKLASTIRLLENSIQGNATIKEVFFKAGNPLQKTFKDWPELLLFNSGRLRSQVSFTLPDNGPLKLSLKGDASGLNGIVNRSELKNLELTFSGELAGQALMLSAPILTIEHLDPGVPLGPIQLVDAHYHANLDDLLQGVADWKSVQASLLNGRVWLHAQQLDLSRTQKLLLQVEGMELQELFKVYPAEGLAGNGIIDGQLPLYIDQNTVYIESGQLQARSPGVLQFRSEKIQALGRSNPAMSIVAHALEDFHFNLLSSGLSYDQSGKLSLDMRLEGQNPDIEKGRPIHLNIKLEEDIPALLASIQLSGQVSEIIQKRVRERLEKR